MDNKTPVSKEIARFDKKEETGRPKYIIRDAIKRTNNKKKLSKITSKFFLLHHFCRFIVLLKEVEKEQLAF